MVPLAEWAVFVMLWFAKDMPHILERQASHAWHEFAVGELADRRLLVVGLGRIGREVARRARALGVHVTGIRRTFVGGDDVDVDRVVAVEDLDDALGEAEVVCLTLPLLPETEGLIGSRELAAMRPGSILINIARGPVVDESALLEALVSGHLGGAALDVFTEEPLPSGHPFWSLPNVIVTPHVVGGSTREHGLIVDLFAENLRRFLSDEPMHNVVDKIRGY